MIPDVPRASSKHRCGPRLVREGLCWHVMLAGIAMLRLTVISVSQRQPSSPMGPVSAELSPKALRMYNKDVRNQFQPDGAGGSAVLQNAFGGGKNEPRTTEQRTQQEIAPL